VLRYPKTALVEPVEALRTVGGVDVLAEPDEGPVDILLVAVGATAVDVLAVAAAVGQAGYSIRVVDPRWVTPINPALGDLARAASLVVTVEDGVGTGGVGSRLSQYLRGVGIDVPAREIGIPTRFLEHGKVPDVRVAAGLSVQNMGRQVVEWAALVLFGNRVLPDNAHSNSTGRTEHRGVTDTGVGSNGTTQNGENVAHNGESVIGTGHRGQERT
jgi:1-deoxy-D-xylulose-5-phosphate synthase